MLQFVLGLLVGGIVGFGVCAVFSVNHDEDLIPADEETGDGNVRNESP